MPGADDGRSNPSDDEVSDEEFQPRDVSMFSFLQPVQNDPKVPYQGIPTHSSRWTGAIAEAEPQPAIAEAEPQPAIVEAEVKSQFKGKSKDMGKGKGRAKRQARKRCRSGSSDDARSILTKHDIRYAMYLHNRECIAQGIEPRYKISESCYKEFESYHESVSYYKESEPYYDESESEGGETEESDYDDNSDETTDERKNIDIEAEKLQQRQKNPPMEPVLAGVRSKEETEDSVSGSSGAATAPVAGSSGLQAAFKQEASAKCNQPFPDWLPEPSRAGSSAIRKAPTVLDSLLSGSPCKQPNPSWLRMSVEPTESEESNPRPVFPKTRTHERFEKIQRRLKNIVVKQPMKPMQRPVKRKTSGQQVTEAVLDEDDDELQMAIAESLAIYNNQQLKIQVGDIESMIAETLQDPRLQQSVKGGFKRMSDELCEKLQPPSEDVRVQPPSEDVRVQPPSL